MNKRFRYIILFPFSFIYGLVTFVRNQLYDKGILKSIEPHLPVISVGNLTVGGTGKTPQVEYLIRLLAEKYKVGMLSRGYKRKSKGFVFADNACDSFQIGDEPYQIYRKFPEIAIAVDADRNHGIEQMLQLRPEIDVIILDDAFQHRSINPGFQILLTDYARLFANDSMLPGGFLREYKSGSKRADLIVVTKCPAGLESEHFLEIEANLCLTSNQQLFFSAIEYGNLIPLYNLSISTDYTQIPGNLQILLVSGIVSYLPLLEELNKRNAEVEVCAYPDHHNFSLNDYAEIERKFLHLQSGKKIILVTEKDAARILSGNDFPKSLRQFIYYLPITIKFLQDKQSLFNKTILRYVESNKRNC